MPLLPSLAKWIFWECATLHKHFVSSGQSIVMFECSYLCENCMNHFAVNFQSLCWFAFGREHFSSKLRFISENNDIGYTVFFFKKSKKKPLNNCTIWWNLVFLNFNLAEKLKTFAELTKCEFVVVYSWGRSRKFLKNIFYFVLLLCSCISTFFFFCDATFNKKSVSLYNTYTRIFFFFHYLHYYPIRGNLFQCTLVSVYMLAFCFLKC